MSEQHDFTYSNVNTRPLGPLIRLGSLVSPGVRQVQQQIVPYAAAWSEANGQALTGDGAVWVVLGDSMSQGVGASSYERGWVGQLRDMMLNEGKHFRIINLSITGARVGDVLERQLPALEALGFEPDLVTVMVGSNDLLRAKYRAQLMQDLTAMLKRLPRGAIVANLLGSAPVVRRANRLIYAQAAVRGFAIADMDHGLRPPFRGKLAPDHFHPNDAGYTDIARVFAAALAGRPSTAPAPKAPAQGRGK